jgi:hypothetical protein
MSLGFYMALPPPVGHHEAAQAQDEFTGIGLAGTGLRAHATVQAAPQVLGLRED